MRTTNENEQILANLGKNEQTQIWPFLPNVFSKSWLALTVAGAIRRGKGLNVPNFAHFLAPGVGTLLW